MRGIYVLIISLAKDIKLGVGSLGKLDFQKGLYAYVGSAQNGLEKRVGRHLGIAKRRFWHIDYLLGNDAAKILKVFYNEAGKVEECRISEKIGEKGVPIRGFGSTDCKCRGHLFKIEGCDFLREFMHEITRKPTWKGFE